MRELPSGCDWVELGGFKEPPVEATDASERWTQTDLKNDVLKRHMPIDFVRIRVVKDTNNDAAVIVERESG